jgi:2-methylcitrate dehydratase PrpD
MIDAVIALRKHQIAPEDVAEIKVVVNPATVRITGVEEPQTGLQSKFSLYHSAAVAFLDGNAGLPQYSDARATAPDTVALRRRIHVATDENFRRDEAHAEIRSVSGKRFEAHVDHASGTRDNPMSDEAMEAKFRLNAEPVLGAEKTGKIAETLWTLDALKDIRDILNLAS